MEIDFKHDALKDTAAWFWANVKGARVFAFHGEMGAGKTTLIHELCKAKGVSGSMGSPTFSIINNYVIDDQQGSPTIYHMDLYRLKDEQEAINAGVEDCLLSDSICLVEWPERALGVFPPETLHVYLQALDSSTRRLRIAGN